MYTNQQVDTRAGLARLFLDKYHTLRAEVNTLSAANKHLEEQLWTKVDALTVANNHLEEQLRLKSDEVAAATTQPASDVVQRLRLILEGRDD